MIAKRIIVNYSVCMQPRVSSAKKLPDYCSVFHRLSTQLTMFCTSITLIREREREDREWEVENMGESYRRQMLRCCISGQRLHCRGSGVEPPSYRSNPPPILSWHLLLTVLSQRSHWSWSRVISNPMSVFQWFRPTDQSRKMKENNMLVKL